MRAKDNPAARAPGRPFTAAEDEVSRETDPVFQAQVEHETVVEETAANPLIDPGIEPRPELEESVDTVLETNAAEGEPLEIEKLARMGELLADEPVGAVSEWMPISTAPMSDPRNEIIVRWSTDDENGRLVSYKLGRRFNGRRWVVGGRWVPKDLQPLPVDEPIEWLRPADYVEQSAEAAA